MEKQDQTALDSLLQAMEKATRLAVEGRYAELEEHADALHAEASSLGDAKALLDHGGLDNAEVDPAEAAEKARLLQQEAFALGRVLQHVRLVQTGLVEIGRAAQGGYERDGHFPGSEGSRLRIEG